MKRKCLGMLAAAALLISGMTAAPQAVYAEDPAPTEPGQITVQIGGAESQSYSDFDSAMAAVRSADDTAEKVITLPAGTFYAASNETFRINEPNTTITGAGEDATVIDTGAFLVSGQAGILVSADNVTIQDLSVTSDHSAGSAGTIKVTTIGDGTSLPDVNNVTISNVKITAAKGYALNLHGVNGASITGVAAETSQFLKPAVNIANATDVTFDGLTATGSGTDVVFSYKEGSAAYNKASDVTFKNSTFANNSVRSERPASAEGGSDKAVFVNVGLVQVINSDGTWSVYEEGSDTVSTAVHNETQDKYYVKSALQAALSGADTGDVIVLQPGTYSNDVTIDNSVTLKGAGESNKDVILTGKVNITADADDVTLDNMWFQQTYQSASDASRLSANGKNLTVSNSVIQRMTGTAKAYGDIISYNASEGTLKLVNTELIAPVSGTADEISAASPSVIGVGAWAQSGEEAWNLEMDNCIVRTNGFAIFDRWNNAVYKNTVFTGLEEVEDLPKDVTVLTCYMALNSTHVDNVSFDGCTFKNMRSWGMLVNGNELSVTNCTFDGSNQSRAISVAYGPTIGKCTITGNVFDLAGSGYGIKFENSVGKDSVIDIADNTFKNSNNEEDGYAVANVDENGDAAENEIDVKGSVFVDSTVYYEGAVNLEGEGVPNKDTVVLVQGNIKYSLPTLAEAVSRAEDGDVIWLLTDLDEETTVGKNITIMKNGFIMDTDKVTGAENYYMTENDEAYVFTYHHAIKVDAKDPTCTENGNIEYWYCDDCGKYFKDAALTKEISKESTVLDKIAHNYKDGVCTVCGAKEEGGKQTGSATPKTGDGLQAGAYAYAGIVSVIVLAAALSFRKRKMK